MTDDTPSLPPDLRPPDDEAARDYERIWAALHRTDEAQAYDVDDAWDDLAERLDLDEANDTATVPPANDRSPCRPDRSPSARIGVRSLALVALAICVVGLGVWWWSQPVSVTTAAGQRTTVTLPDGSTAELNGGTTLTYASGFRSIPLVGPERRRVRLEGEAFFSVEERDRPFRVVTANAQVEVLGTRFNVQARADDRAPTTTVTLASGRVRLSGGSGNGTGVTLSEEGHVSRVAGTQPPTPPRTVALKYAQAWRQGGFAVVDASLPTVLRELERRFGTTLRLRVPAAETKAMTLHYSPERARLENILRDICMIQGLRYRETSRGYELVRT